MNIKNLIFSMFIVVVLMINCVSVSAYTINVVTIGGVGCGKTSLLSVLSGEGFCNSGHDTTVGRGCFIFCLENPEKEEVNIKAFDTAGRYNRSLTNNYLREADVVFFCIDASNQEESMNWSLAMLKPVLCKNIFVIITKNDLAREPIILDVNKIGEKFKYCGIKKCTVLSTSSLTGKGIDDLKKELADIKPSDRSGGVTIIQQTQNDGCC
ncbi:MAG: GTPase domain-containing protein [Oscillospiraceae bacterium]|jgi:small GTP-binding protein|nr:GTPase domain-containing protein [Oscillospiraceae bacterium]